MHLRLTAKRAGAGVGFEPPAVSVLGWMNPGNLLRVGLFETDNSLIISLNVHLTLAGAE